MDEHGGVFAIRGMTFISVAIFTVNVIEGTMDIPAPQSTRSLSGEVPGVRVPSVHNLSLTRDSLIRICMCAGGRSR